MANDRVEELLLRVDQNMFDCTQGLGSFLESLGGVGIDTARIDAGRDNVAAVILL
jgi:hypothetical protein